MHAWFPMRADSVRSLDPAPLSQSPAGLTSMWRSPARVGAVGRFSTPSDQARAVKDILLLSPTNRPTVVTYDQLGPVALMTADVDALRRFVHARLESSPSMANARKRSAAALTFLGHNRSYTAPPRPWCSIAIPCSIASNARSSCVERDLNDPDVASTSTPRSPLPTGWAGRG